MNSAAYNFCPPIQQIDISTYDDLEHMRTVSFTIRDTNNQLFALHVQTQESYDEGVVQGYVEQSGITDPEPVLIVPTETLDAALVAQLVQGTDPIALAPYLVPQQA